MMKRSLARSLGLAAALCLSAAAAAKANPAFLGFALTPSLVPPSALSEESSARSDPAALLRIIPDFSATPAIDLPPTKLERAFFDRPSRPNLAAKRQIFDAPTRPLVELEWPVSR